MGDRCYSRHAVFSMQQGGVIMDEWFLSSWEIPPTHSWDTLVRTSRMRFNAFNVTMPQPDITPGAPPVNTRPKTREWLVSPVF
jgi:hypothetical protein